MARISTIAIFWLASCAPMAADEEPAASTEPVQLALAPSGQFTLRSSPSGDRPPTGLSVQLYDADGQAHWIATRQEGSLFVGELPAGMKVVRSGHATLLVAIEGTFRRSSAIVRELPEPSQGGSVIALGEHAGEVVVDQAGRVRLHAPPGFEVTLGLPTDDGELPLALSWDEEQGHYAGQLLGSRPRPGALSVELRRDERRILGGGLLREVAPDAFTPPEVPELRLELPELGSELPAVIPVPPAP